jgi:anthranilate phosphoribosyltransferase
VSKNSDSSLIDITRHLSTSQDLSESEIIDAGTALISESVSAEAKRDFLLAWQEKGEQPKEVAYLADFFRKKAKDPGLQEYAGRAIDIVGTGGDKAGTFNISTTTAIIVAAGGVPVIKHGNRSITSKTGAADLLESLGIPLDAEPALLKRSMEHNGFVFLFAPGYHPAFKSIVPVRKELAEAGKKTVFNILGPLINPAGPAFQLMGVFKRDWVSPLAETLTQVGIKRGLVAHSDYQGQALDEMTSIGDNTLSPAGKVTAAEMDALRKLTNDHKSGTLHDLKGGTPEDNLKIFETVLDFKANMTLLNTLCLNAGAAFRLVENVSGVEEGFEKAQQLLQSGTVRKWVSKTRSFFQHES